jgi:hypothetical protein
LERFVTLLRSAKERYAGGMRRSVSLILLAAALLLAAHHAASVDATASGPTGHGGAMPAMLAGACVGVLILAMRTARWLGRPMRERLRAISAAPADAREQPRYPPPRSLAVLCVLQR